MGIIMRNTAILIANTNIAGHSSHFPYDDFEEFLQEYFGNNRDIDVKYHGTVKIEITPQEAISLSNEDINPLMTEEAVDKYGQTYFPWVTQSDADRFAAQADINKMVTNYGEIVEYIEEYNNSHRREKITINQKNGKIYWAMDIFDFIDKIGLFDWMMMPDGSDAWSDYGIDPLLKILEEYNENLPPEKVLVLVNRALDVYHQRGDMASIFIQGGSKALSRIAEEVERNTIKVYITEQQLINLKHG
jgi:hypothetical protein